jgi:hypothetical protein
MNSGIATVAITINDGDRRGMATPTDKRKTKIMMIGAMSPHKHSRTDRDGVPKGEEGAPTLVTDRDYL